MVLKIQLSVWMKQLIKEARKPVPGARGRSECQDYKCEGCGVFNIFMANGRLAGKRVTKLTEPKTKFRWA